MPTAEPTPRVLVVDDEPNSRGRLSAALARAGHKVIVAASGEHALAEIDADLPDVMVLDLALPGRAAFEAMRRAHQVVPDLPVVVLAANDSNDDAGEALELGVHDIVTKPVEPRRLVIAVRNALSNGRLLRQVRALAEELRARYRFDEIVGWDGGLAPVLRRVERVIPTGAPVLLHGEPGTGKELLARAIHNQGPRAGRPFVVVNSATLPAPLLETELFGHEKGTCAGAGTTRPGRFETAQGGTLFLDEVAGLARSVQGRLLSALDEHVVSRVGGEETIPVNVRLIAATSADLATEVRAGRFSEGLFARLAVNAVGIPPLRERPGDIAALVRHILGNSRGPAPGVNPAAMTMLEAYPWPGNVRELQNVMRRARVLAADGPIRPEHLPSAVQASLGESLQVFPGQPPVTLGPAPPAARGGPVATLDDMERDHILKAVEACRGNLSQAARALAIGRTTLYRKLQRYGMVVTAP